MRVLVLIVILIVLIVGFIFLWKENHNTPIPEEAFDSIPECEGCSNKACGNYKSKESK
ncbi:MAG: hypothetical protein ACK5K7_03905 [Bacilli bacterium]